MFNDVIFMVVLIVVLLIIWIALKLNIKVRSQKLQQIKKQNLGSYVTFLNNFNIAEEEEKKGNIKIARIHFEKALRVLEEEENPDDLVTETIAEVKERIAALE